MRSELSCLPLALLFLANVVPSSYGQKTGSARAGAPEERLLAVAPGAPLTVECALRPEQRAEWRLDGRAVPEDMRAGEAAPAPGAALTARLTAPAARAHHAGVYSCAPGSPRTRVQLVARTAETTTPVSNGDADTIGSDVYFELHRNFSFNCADVLDLSSPISWEKNGTAIEKLPDVSARVVLEPVNNVNDALLKLAPGMRASDADVGNYTCRTAAAEHTWQLKAKPRASMHSDTNVVEGQKLKLTCKLIGRPYPPVEWSYSNMSENMENATAVKEALGERATTKVSEQGVENGELTVEPAQRSDAGWYRCTPLGQHGTPAVTRLRVKDMYAALWPFLGICAEVLVLCAIILVYEKRRTKPELDDSDTDNHDQKKS